MPTSTATKGCEGIIKTKPQGSMDPFVTVVEVRDWNLTETTDIMDVSTLGSCSRKKIPGIKSASGSLTAYLSEAANTDTVNGARGVFINGDTIDVELYPTGDDTSNPDIPDHTIITFEAIITETGVSGSADGMVEIAVSFEVSGAVTWGVV